MWASELLHPEGSPACFTVGPAVPFQLAWVLYCDLICLDCDGNILDACTFALLAALKNGKLPQQKAVFLLPPVLCFVKLA